MCGRISDVIRSGYVGTSRQNNMLGNETKEMLQRFIPKDLEARMPATLEPHKIPGAFQPVLNFVQQSLSGAV